MPFKDNWEGPLASNQLNLDKVEILAKNFCSLKAVEHLELLTGGAGNLNYKVLYKDDPTPYILRIYYRDSRAAFLEQALGQLLGDSLPLPRVLSIQEGDFPCALGTFIEGIALKDLLMKSQGEDVFSVLQEAGRALAKIHEYSFPVSGMLTPSLEVKPFPFCFKKDEELGLALLQKPVVQEVLSPSLLSQVGHLFHSESSFFPEKKPASLVHGDFNPANIFVKKENGSWRISGVLDWEFAFSGNPLWDVANFLRYAHTQSPFFRANFLKGFKEEGGYLPEGWEITIELLNMISLLDILASRTDPETQPNRVKDIQDLMRCSVERLGKRK